jgi:thiol-disulfide isomerase/thioredoxin
MSSWRSVLDIRTYAVPALAVLCACGTQGQPERDQAPSGNEAAEILEAADSATQAVQSVEYSFSFSGTGDMASTAPFHGTARMARGDSGMPLVWARFTPDTLDTGESTPDLTLSTDGSSAFMLDATSSFFISGLISEGADDILSPLTSAAMMEYVLDGPFQAELAGDTIRYEGVDTVAGVECDVVYVVYQDDQGRARWFFGRDDRLPRRVERFDTGRTVRGAQVLEVADLVCGSAADPASFVLTAPDGFAVETYRAILPAGTPAPDWTLSTLDGTPVSLSALRDTVVVMDFWATWCGPCNLAMPVMQAVHEDYAGMPVRVIGVDIWEDGDVPAFLAEKGITYTVVVGGDSVASDYLVTAIPTFYIIDGQGVVSYSARGFDPEHETAIAEAVERALAGN